MKQYTKYTFFYRTRNPFSNWHPCTFEDEEGNEYNCSEQWMMAGKAKLFGDEETREDILFERDPGKQKALGRKVKNFDSSIWNEFAKQIVYDGCYLKFTQNPKLLAFLLETEGTLLVEAAAYDTVWGIGLSEDDPKIHDPKNWRGTNWLGEVLTQLRDDLINSKQSNL
ncbi:NADAR [uncultured Caudovirales phage]|uniref:NADAR n=1 Tax=uncultured Caudovirales phage TaxID=2100421 RepID=A0A6J5PUI1_9CAUD|nr:NADAR [uncultured Caudovirales phage]CAB4193788.1 NADAR [uncultured Caudovirales phage]